MRSFRKFASAHASVINHINTESHLYSRNISKPAFTDYERDEVNSTIEIKGKLDEETGDVRLPPYGLGLPIHAAMPWPANTPTRNIGERMKIAINELKTNALVRISPNDNRRATCCLANIRPSIGKAPKQ